MKGGAPIEVKSIQKKLNISSDKLAKELGISKASLYYRLSGEQSWKLPELIRLNQLQQSVSDDDTIEVSCNGIDYLVRITMK